MIALSLDQLTIVDAPPLDLVRIAGKLGYPLISLFTHSPVPEHLPPLDPALEEAMRDALAAGGVGIGNLECFDLSPDMQIEAYRPAIALGARLGARMATAINHQDPDQDRVVRHFAAFCALCAEYGLRANIEPFSTGMLRTLGEAVQLIDQVDMPNAGIVVDALHLFRTGGTVEELRAIDPGLIGYAQICDAPASVAADMLGVEATEARLYPGEGDLPLRDFLAALPSGIIIGVETPSRIRRTQGATAEQRAAEALVATKRIIAALPRAEEVTGE